MGVPDSAKITMDSSINKHSIIEPTVTIGESETIAPYVVILGDVVIGDGVTIDSFVQIVGPVKIEEGAYIGPGTCINHTQVLYSDILERYYAPTSLITIGSDVMLGSNVHILPGENSTIIGDGTTIHSNVLLQGCEIGTNCLVQCDVCVAHAKIGNNTRILARSSVRGKFGEPPITIGHDSTIHEQTNIRTSCAPHSDLISLDYLLTGIPKHQAFRKYMELLKKINSDE